MPVVDADDDCNVVTVTTDQTTVPGTCAHEMTLQRTATADDGCGSVSHSWAVTVVDTEAPVFSNKPGDKEVECPYTAPAPPVSVTDNCDIAPTLDFTESSTTTGTNGAGTITRTWHTSDECGNTDTHTQVITIVDTSDPSLTVPGDSTIECPAAPPAADYSADDTCSDVDVVVTESKTDGSCIGYFTITRTYVATDENGNSVTQYQTINSEDTTPPYFTGTAVSATQSFEACAPYDRPDRTANDDCSTAPVTAETVTLFPNGDGVHDPCHYQVQHTWTATDDCGLTAQESQVVTWRDNQPPTWDMSSAVFATTYPTEDHEDPYEVVRPTLTASDCNDVTINEDTQLTSDSCVSTYIHTWVAVDACGNQNPEVRTQTVTVSDTTAPSITVPDDITVHWDEVPNANSADATCSDENTCTTKFLREEKTETSKCVYVLVRYFEAKDVCGLTSTGTQTITVIDPDGPQFVNVPEDQVAECDQEIDLTCAPTVHDDCDGNTIEINYTSQTTTPSTTTKAGQKTVRTWTATDSSGHTITATQTITLEDTTPPTFSSTPADVTVECDCDSFPTAPNVQALDNCDTPAIQTASFVEQTVAGASEHEYQLVRTWSAVDQEGLQSTHIQTITVTDTTAPTLLYTPDNQSFACESIPTERSNYARDNCDETVTVVETATTAAGSCEDDYTITRSWTATDKAGNTVSHSHEIQIFDTDAPKSYGNNLHCVMPGEDNKFAQFIDPIGSLFGMVSDNCGEPSITIQACNSTAHANPLGDNFEQECYLSSGDLYVKSSALGTEATYNLYAILADQCGNSREIVKNFWVPAAFETIPAGSNCLPAESDGVTSPTLN
jgi:hypothetical protein